MAVATKRKTKAAPAAMRAPAAAESSPAPRDKRVRLSKALAATPTDKSVVKMASKNSVMSTTPKKLNWVSHTYKIPEAEYAQLAELKARLLTLGVGVKKGELLRVGLKSLVALNDVQLRKAVAGAPLVKGVSPIVPSIRPTRK